MGRGAAPLGGPRLSHRVGCCHACLLLARAARSTPAPVSRCFTLAGWAMNPSGAPCRLARAKSCGHQAHDQRLRDAFEASPGRSTRLRSIAYLTTGRLKTCSAPGFALDAQLQDRPTEQGEVNFRI